jgi:alkanesulfonate monooxygenase SsuD/methylene tetrahydromethanopterin reductase-like flavin-dependent oxidoreductase (luciferase family)
MRFGAHYLPTYVTHLDRPVENYYRLMFEQMEELERLGFDDLWVTEHHFSEYGGILPHPPTFLSAIARTTQRIRLGTAVSVLPLHSPFELAESYAMVDVISNGRLEFGIGRGAEPIEYKKAGFSQEKVIPKMREMINILRLAWSDEPVNFSGEFFQYHDVRMLPKPVQRPHPPIWVGATRSEETFRWAGEKGFNLMTLPFMSPSPEYLGQCIKLYREALGRTQPGEERREVLGKFHVYVTDSLDQAVREAVPYLGNYYDIHAAADPDRGLRGSKEHDFASDIAGGFVIAGDPQRCIDSIRQWKEVGLTAMSGTFHFGGMPHELALKNIRLFAEQVMPAFNGSAAL